MRKLSPGRTFRVNEKIAKRIIVDFKKFAQAIPKKKAYRSLEGIAEMSDEKILATSAKMSEAERQEVVLAIDHLSEIKQYFI